MSENHLELLANEQSLSELYLEASVSKKQPSQIHLQSSLSEQFRQFRIHQIIETQPKVINQTSSFISFLVQIESLEQS